MKKRFISSSGCLLLVSMISLLSVTKLFAQDKPITVSIDWNNITMVSKTTPTLQVVENPMVTPGSLIHRNIFKALKDLGADYVRYVPWFPYPKMAVAE